MSYKILTHDFKPPLQGGDAVWDGKTLPFELLKVPLSTSGEECGAGWNYTESLSQAFLIAGLWRDGRPSCCLRVEPSKDAIARGNKSRCSQLTIVGRVPRAEVLAAIHELSEPFDSHRMAESQMMWFEALGRPKRNKEAVREGLQLALDTRGLDWVLQEFDSDRDAWDTWNAWDAWDARDALTVEYASIKSWTEDQPLLLTSGLREAYNSGLEIGLPVGKNILGYAMKEKK